MTRFDKYAVLMRHGDTGAEDRKDVVGGRSEDIRLLPRGLKQAAAAGALVLPAVARIIGVAESSVVIGDLSVSPTTRTVQTGTSLGLGQPTKVDDLTEWSKGRTEGRARKTVETAAYLARAEAQGRDFRPDEDYPNPISESPGQVLSRMRRWLATRPAYDQSSVVRVSLGVSHGYTMSFLRADVVDPRLSPLEAVQQYIPPYLSGYVLGERNGEWTLLGDFVLNPLQA